MLLAVRWRIVLTTTWGQVFHILSGVGEAGRGGRVVRTIAWPRGRLARCHGGHGLHPEYTPPAGRQRVSPQATPMLTAAVTTVARMWKQPKCPSTDKH